MLKGTDDAAFGTLMQDLCLAFNRQYSPELSRVFWETLKHAHIAEVRRKADEYRRNGKKFPTPHDLMPDRRAATPPPPQDDGPAMSTWAIAANKILFCVAYQGHRGMTPMGEKLPALLVAKADFVRMAEEDAANGRPWETRDYNQTCREGFQKLLG